MSETRPSLRLIGYVRVSRVAGREGESFQSPAVQRERVEAYVRASGHTLLDVFEELDKSGGDSTRPRFQEAIEAVERGEADGIVVARLDRFARSLGDAIHALRRIEGVGGQLIVQDLGLDATTTHGRL